MMTGNGRIGAAEKWIRRAPGCGRAGEEKNPFFALRRRMTPGKIRRTEQYDDQIRTNQIMEEKI
jgi:hypothetical protein